MIPIILWLFFLIDNLYGKGSGIKPLKPSNEIEILTLKNVLYYISFVKSFLYLATGIITIYERKKLLREIKNSPLLLIDDSLTEEIYQNIIQQSKFPDNPVLIEEYRRLLDSRRKTVSEKTVNDTYDNFGKDTINTNIKINSKIK